MKSRLGWNGWMLNAELLALELPRFYEIDLERCLTSAETLDWIAQVAGKEWATDQRLAGLVRALNDVLRPQGTLCGSGRSHVLSKRQVRTLVRDFTAS